MRIRAAHVGSVAITLNRETFLTTHTYVRVGGLHEAASLPTKGAAWQRAPAAGCLG